VCCAAVRTNMVRPGHRPAGEWRCELRAHNPATHRWEAGNVRGRAEYYAAAPERMSGRQIPVPGGVKHHLTRSRRLSSA